MTQQFEEQLSALMDGELGRDETRFLLRRTEGDVALVGRWTRYHVARQALRRQDVFALRGGFAGAVMARLEAEQAPRDRHLWLRWGSGGAIAAAVAVAALMVTKPASEPSPIASMPGTVRSMPAQAEVAASAHVPLPAPLVPNSPIQTTVASFGSDLTEPASFDPRLQSYLLRHYQATGTTGQPDLAPYVAPYVLLAQPARPIESREPAQQH